MLCCGGRGGRKRCARVAAVLLAHVNLLLMLFSGAALATVARLKWDPTAYIPVREALPGEYRAACGALLLFALAVLALAHAALAALLARRASAWRRAVLFTYAALMCVLTLGEVGALAWVATRVAAFLESPAAAQFLDLLELRDHLRAALQILARWYPLPDRINDLINEAIADGPRNGYVAEGATIALFVLQPAAAALALAAALPRPAPRAPRTPRASVLTLATNASAGAYSHHDQRGRYNYLSEADGTLEKAPLRTTYRNGRIVVL